MVNTTVSLHFTLGSDVPQASVASRHNGVEPVPPLPLEIRDWRPETKN